MDTQDKRELILQAAIHLFTKKGFDAASVQEIAGEAGVAKGTMYLYFRSKEDLVEQVFQHCYQMDVEACNVGLDQESGALDKLCRRLYNIVEYALGHPLEAQIEALYVESPVYCPNRYECQRQLYEDIDAIMREGIAGGELKRIPSALMTEIYYGITAAMYRMFQKEPEKWLDSHMKEECCRVIRDCFSETVR